MEPEILYGPQFIQREGEEVVQIRIIRYPTSYLPVVEKNVSQTDLPRWERVKI
jgi:hypothetical protein